MSELRSLLQRYVDDGTGPGAVALVGDGDGDGDRAEAAAVGSLDTGGSAPMARDTIYGRAGGTAARSTWPPPARGTCRAATAGPAAPAPPPTSSPRRGG